MSKRNKARRVSITLEQQLAALGPRPVLPKVVEPWMSAEAATTIKAQLDWDRRRAELSDAIRRRDDPRIVDPGRDAGGNFDVSPFVARWHKVETAPRTLRQDPGKSPDSKFPRRITTQRMIDRYKVRSQITLRQWQAANRLLEIWRDLGMETRLVQAYDGTVARTHRSTRADFPGEDILARKIDAAARWTAIMEAIPYRSRGVVRAVVIEDQSASLWAHGRGYSKKDSGRLGLMRLRTGLQALVDHFGY